MICNNNIKVKKYEAVSRNALKLDSQIISSYLLYCSCRLSLPNYVELISKYDPQRGQLDRLLGMVDQCLVLTQPVHSKNDVNALLILRFTFGHSCHVGISPLGELTII
jgi:hypothetical protein